MKQEQVLRGKKMAIQEETWEQKIVGWIRRTRPTIYCICRHVSSSGMSRRMSFYAIKNNKPVYLDALIAEMAGYKFDKHKQGLRVSGCGMDMGFAVVYEFSCRCFPDGFKYRKGVTHRNGDPSPIDKDGGYALTQSWL